MRARPASAHNVQMTLEQDGRGAGAVVHVSGAPGDIARGLDMAATIRRFLPDVAVHVIVNGAALDGVTGNEPVRVPAGVRLSACAFGMSKRGLAEADLRPGLDTVPSAAAALVQAQLDGAAYLRI